MPANIFHFSEMPPEERSLLFQVPLPEGAGGNPLTRLSPDGRWIAFQPTAERPILVRALDELAARPLPGSGGSPYNFFWSPDGRSIGFGAGGKLRRIDVAGGPATVLADDSTHRGGSWSPEGVILFASSQGPLMRIKAEGGTATPATTLRQGEYSHRWPWFLPDGKHYLYAATTGPSEDHTTIHVGELDSQFDKIIGEADSQPMFSKGHVLFVRETTLIAQPFDLRNLAITGAAVAVAEQIQRQVSYAYAEFSATPDGLLEYRTGTNGGLYRLTWFDRSGKQLGTLGEPSGLGNFQMSPDRRRAAVADSAGNRDIWIYDVAPGLRSRFTFDPATDSDPVWSPDGREIIFSRRSERFGLYRKASDGSGTESLLLDDARPIFSASWSPDGNFLLYIVRESSANDDIWILPLPAEGDKLNIAHKPYPLMRTPFRESYQQFSPNGKWVAYQSNESGRNEIYVTPFHGPGETEGGKRQISIAGGVVPRWRQDGKELFYVAPDQRLMAAEIIIKGNALDVGEVRPLFGPVMDGVGFYYDVSADGQRILARRAAEDNAEPVTVVQNWTARLKK